MVTIPAYAPTSWELTLPGWPVIANSWRSSEFPEILGSASEGAQLRLRYENIPDAEATQLLMLWRATAGGLYQLDALPAEVAAGISDPALAARLLNITPLTWTAATPPRQQSVKAGRSSVDIELRSELRLVLNTTLPVITCPAWSARALVGCAGGAGGVGPPSVKPLPPLLVSGIPALPAEMKILWIGDPFGALGLADAGAVIGATTNDIYGAQTVKYLPGIGFAVLGGGFVTRDEQAGDTTRHSYRALELYGLDGVFIRRLAYRGFTSGTYLYSFNCPQQLVALNDGRLLAYLGTQFALADDPSNFVVCNPDLSAPSLRAYSWMNTPVWMQQGPLTGRIYSIRQGFDHTWIDWIDNTLIAQNSVRLNNGESKAVIPTNVGGTELAVLLGNSGPPALTAFNAATSSVVNAWNYADATDWTSYPGFTPANMYFEGGVRTADNKILAAGRGVGPALFAGNTQEGMMIAKLNPADGSVEMAATIVIKDTDFYGYDFQSSPGVAVAPDGSICVACTPFVGPPAVSNFKSVCLLVRLSPTLDLLAANHFIAVTGSGVTSGSIEVAGNDLAVPIHCDESSRRNGAVFLVPYAQIGAGIAGTYSYLDQPGFYVSDFTPYVASLPISLTPTPFTWPVGTTNIAADATANITTSEKEPAHVLLIKPTA